MITTAKKKYPKHNFKTGDALTTIFSGSFDAITCFILLFII